MQRRRAAVKVALSILIILVASALIGLKVLSIFGISLDVFRLTDGLPAAEHVKSHICNDNSTYYPGIAGK